jgi:SAM-dependent methyltransferase
MSVLFDNPKWRAWVWENHWLPVLQQIEKNIGVGSILDMGCSDGLFMNLAAKRGWDVYGTDLNEKKLSKLRRRYGSNVSNDSVYKLCWEDAHFDAVRLCHVLEHLTNPKAGLISLHRVLRKDGILNIGIPVFDRDVYTLVQKVPVKRLRERLIRHLGWIDPPHHLTTWSTRTIEWLLHELGFKIIWKSYRSDVLPWVKGFRRWYLFFCVVDVPLKLLGSGATIELLARKCR